MNWKLFQMILSGFCACVYAFEWYNGIQIPAWQALIWVLVAFVNDLDDYVSSRLNSKFY